MFIPIILKLVLRLVEIPEDDAERAFARIPGSLAQKLRFEVEIDVWQQIVANHAAAVGIIEPDHCLPPAAVGFHQFDLSLPVLPALAQQSAKVAFQHQHNLVVGDVGIIDTMKELRVEVVIGQVSPEHP
ncbi:MAG: hypothetical protein IPK19_23340 [Chloroflexi bacterium]|nr:hypothetical protein [Chloroflexota bacterium]